MNQYRKFNCNFGEAIGIEKECTNTASSGKVVPFARFWWYLRGLWRTEDSSNFKGGAMSGSAVMEELAVEEKE